MPDNPSDTPFDIMRQVFAPQGTADVTNLTMNLTNPYFDSNLIAQAVNAAEARVLAVAKHPDIAEPLSPLERFAIQLLMYSSGQG